MPRAMYISMCTAGGNPGNLTALFSLYIFCFFDFVSSEIAKTNVLSICIEWKIGGWGQKQTPYWKWTIVLLNSIMHSHTGRVKWPMDRSVAQKQTIPPLLLHSIFPRLAFYLSFWFSRSCSYLSLSLSLSIRSFHIFCKQKT